MEHVFVALPEGRKRVTLVDAAGKAVRQVLWGDWLWLDDGRPDDDPDWRHVVWSPNDPVKRQYLRVRREHTTDERPLEIVFVDVGQGDGAVLITPERDHRERVMVIDAGKGPEMNEFLTERFGGYRDGLRFHAAVITHADEDHYRGFQPIFGDGRIGFANCYHSGLVEWPTGAGFDGAGGLVEDEVTGVAYLQALATHDAAMRAIFAGAPSARRFARTVQAAIARGSVGRFAMLSTAHGQAEDGRSWMPGFAPSDGRGYTLEVLGPVAEFGPRGARLRRLGDYGVTKNGHSVILRLTFNSFRVLFGGDLNRPAEQHLLKHHAGLERWPRTPAERAAMLAAAGPRLRSEVMKVCHHGSADVTDEFLAAVDPAAFVISSGDEEGHVHPRPDLLGRLGKLGRGASPVLLSTELQRSTRAREDAALTARLRRDIAAQVKAADPARAERIEEAIRTLGRANVSVDGAIYLKTDGERLITAFKKETGSATDKWFYFEYGVRAGELVLEGGG